MATVVLREGVAETIRIDCCFPVLHGFGGEDGTVQGLLTLAGIPFVGPGVAASADSMDKSLTKVIVDRAGVRQAAYYVALRPDFESDPNTVLQAAVDTLKQFPVFIKPCSSGSSVGVHKAADLDSLREGLAEAFRWDEKVLVEEFIAGREMRLQCSATAPCAHQLREKSPPRRNSIPMTPSITTILRRCTFRRVSRRRRWKPCARMRCAFLRRLAAAGCLAWTSSATVDGDEIIFNEINTIPGFTSISMYPKLFAHEGISYPALIDALVELAMEEHHG